MSAKAKKAAGERFYKHGQGAVPADNADPDVSATISSLDQVRDILFGEQVRQQDTKHQVLEQEVNEAVGSLRSTITDEIKTLAVDMQKQLSSERKARKKQSDEIFEKLGELSQAISTLDNRLAEGHEQLNEQIASRTKQLASEVHELHEKATEFCMTQTSELQNSKMDRNNLAEMLKIMAGEIGKTPDDKS